MPYDPFSIRAEMARRRVTVDELATRTGLAASGIHKALAPGANPTAKTLEKIAEALGVSEGLFFAPRAHCSGHDIDAAPAAS